MLSAAKHLALTAVVGPRACEAQKTGPEKPNNARSHYSLGVAYANRGDDSLAAEHLHKAGLIFLKKGKRINALKSYEALKQTDSKELAQNLYKKLHPAEKQVESESSQ